MKDAITRDKEESRMKFLSRIFEIRTDKGPQFVDITDRVVEAVRQSGLENGFAVIFSKHTTAAIRINEAEPHLIADMEQMLEKIVPSCHEYAHNRYAHAVSSNGERPNGHAHCQQLLLGASEAVPIVAGQLMFGRWQRIFLVELDHGRDREVVVHLVGE
ncbi:MAG: secondary thiamine-phosphate synthase enzyme YjbQ [Dehalococcoidia bacterium]|nr:secondary thiamine-phosphate synthase enzyme YjbQ [Dehalococcoidia bacterium]